MWTLSRACLRGCCPWWLPSWARQWMQTSPSWRCARLASSLARVMQVGLLACWHQSCVQACVTARPELGSGAPSWELFKAPALQAGLDSLAAVDLRNAIGAAFGCTLAPTAVFDHPSAAALAGAICAASPQQQPQQLLRPRSAAQHVGHDVASTLAGILQEVLGAVPPPDQPLMEVRPGFRRHLGASAAAPTPAQRCGRHARQMLVLWSVDLQRLQECWTASRRCVRHLVLARVQAGLDSLAAVDLRNAISSQLGLSVAPTLAFDYPTLAALSKFLSERLEPQHAPAALSAAGSLHVPQEAAALRSNVLAVGCRFPSTTSEGGCSFSRAGSGCHACNVLRCMAADGPAAS